MTGIPGLRGLQDLGRLLIPDRTPPGGVVRSSGAMPSVAPVSVMPQVAPAAAPLTPTAKYIQDMQALISGGIGPLSTGQKISAVGQVLQAAGSRGATDPGAVIQNVRKQQMEKLNAQYQIAQLQQAQQQEAAQRASIAKYTELLTDNERAALEGLPLDKRAEKISEIAFRPKQVQQIVRTADGKTRIVYQNGDDQIADWSLPAKTKYENLGNKLVLVDEDTGKPVLNADGKPQELKVNMSPAQAANYGLAERRFAFDRSRPVGGGSEPSYQILNTTGGYVGVNKKNLTQQVPLGLSAPKTGATIDEGTLAEIMRRAAKQR
jgi:hypothetical protein